MALKASQECSIPTLACMGSRPWPARGGYRPPCHPGGHRGEHAPSLIDQTTATPRNPFDKKYSKEEDAAWESCALVLNSISVRELMEAGWG